jgi:hypothetical protein
VVSILACHARDPGSIPGQGAFFIVPDHTYMVHSIAQAGAVQQLANFFNVFVPPASQSAFY